MNRNVAVVVGGLVRGRELSGPAEATLTGGALHLVRVGGGDVILAIPLDALEGLRYESGQLTLYLTGDDAAELVSETETELRALGRELLASACSLPELTRALRALGSHRSTAFVEHDRFFTPFLNARRSAEAARDPLAQVAAFDVAVLRARLDELVRRTAAERYPEHPPARRALEAELQECVEPLAERLAALGEAAVLARGETEEMRIAAWRRWSVRLADVFACADACWVETAGVLRLDPYRTPPRSWWQRLTGRGEGAR